MTAVYAYFTARLGSVSWAAGEPGLSPSAVSRYIRLLEGQLGTRLFRRVAFALAAIHQDRSNLAKPQAWRSPSVRGRPSFGVCWLGPEIAGSAAPSRGWSIRVDATPKASDSTVEAIDLGIRDGFSDWPASPSGK